MRSTSGIWRVRTDVRRRRSALALGVIAVFGLSAGMVGSQPVEENSEDAPLGDTAGIMHEGDVGRPESAAPALAMPHAGKEMKFVSLPPCRIFDTRVVVGDLAHLEIRGFKTTGTLTGQGGKSGGCGVPASARAVEINLGAIATGGAAGYLKAYANSDPEPLASAVNFPSSGPISNKATVEMDGTFSINQIKVKAFQSAHVFADVVGYYMRPMYALIAENGSVVNAGAGPVSSELFTSERVDVGVYVLNFNRPTAGCVASATHLDTPLVRFVQADTLYGPSQVMVSTFDASSSPANSLFYLSLDC